jgi:hypothetical protein
MVTKGLIVTSSAGIECSLRSNQQIQTIGKNRSRQKALKFEVGLLGRRLKITLSDRPVTVIY